MSIWLQPADTADRTQQLAHPALFLDRDGVVIADENYLADPERIRILPGVTEALVRARQAGFLLIGVSNQSGIGRGYFGQDDFARVMERLQQQLAAAGAGFDSFHYCPHGPDDGCSCRKPLPGMLDEARSLFSLDESRSWMVGDKASDVAFGRDAGLGAVLVRTGYGTGQEQKVARDYPGDALVLVADHLPAAVDLVLERHSAGDRG